MPTKKDLQDELDALGIEYGAKASKAELAALLDDAATTDAGDTAVSYADVTGLCRQCNKPADHLHQGV